MKTIFALVLIFFSQSLFATLLIPSSKVKPDQYFEKCHLDGYNCLPQFIVHKTRTLPRPKFENWLMNLDLNDSFQRKNIQTLVKDILFTEMLTIDELLDVIHILEKSLEIEKNQNLSLFTNQLKNFREILFYEPEVNSETDFVLVFQKKVSSNFFKKNYFQFKKINHYKLNTTSYSSHKFEHKPYVMGYCEDARLDEDLGFLVETQTYLIENYKSCKLSTETIEILKKTKNWAVENKENILWGTLLAIGIYHFQKNYEVNFK